ncbi:MAG TPA: alpha/beta hydrolase [Chthoniobacterales bacterium]|nr:alpha/beta hydrolase [Chthoniobacterales bacterium]
MLVHGLNISGHYLLPLAKELNPIVPILIPDLLGYGKSSHSWPPLGLKRFAAILRQLLIELDYPKAHFVGNSFGCQIIVELAASFPEIVDRLVLQSPTMDPSARNPLVALSRCLRNAAQEPSDLNWLTLRENLSVCPLRAAYTLLQALRDRPENKLPRIEAPTLVVWGSSDVITSRQWAERVVTLLRHGSLAILPGVTHTANYVAPVELSNAILSFLRTTD